MGRMTEEHSDTDQFRGARFTGVDLSGATFRDCDLRGVKIVDAWLTDVSVSGLIGNLRVNDVDVVPLVEAELDRQHPERVQLRAVASADDHRAMWATIERLWSETVERARRLPEPRLHERVDDEWSFTETLRHLVFGTDAWVGRSVLGHERPYSPLGLTYSGYPADQARALGVATDATPTLDEVLEVRVERMATVRGIIADLTDAGLEQSSDLAPAPGYPDESRTVRRCLGVVMREECEHRRYAVRDLSVLESREANENENA
jgi:hypothetical protein